METKKAKVTKVTRLEKQDQHGNTTFIIELENGDRGFFTTKNPDQDKFVVGNVSDYEIEKRTGSTGKDYFKITLPKTEGGGGNWKGGGKPQRDPKEQCASFACAYTKDLVIGNKVSMEKFEETFERLYKLMASKFL